MTKLWSLTRPRAKTALQSSSKWSHAALSTPLPSLMKESSMLGVSISKANWGLEILKIDLKQPWLSHSLLWTSFKPKTIRTSYRWLSDQSLRKEEELRKEIPRKWNSPTLWICKNRNRTRETTKAAAEWEERARASSIKVTKNWNHLSQWISPLSIRTHQASTMNNYSTSLARLLTC